MKIIQQNNSINIINYLHEEIFGAKFPMDKHKLKAEKYNIFNFLFVINDKPIGFAILHNQEKKNLYGWYGGILPDYQGMGYIYKFLDFFLEFGKKHKYESISFATYNTRPRMICAAIKWGFSIDKIKNRDYGDGNKIYFKYLINYSLSSEILTININEPSSIDYVDSLNIPILANNRLSYVGIERILISAYKNGCENFVFSGIKTAEDKKILLYGLNYCRNFSRKFYITLEIDKKMFNSDVVEEIKKLKKDIYVYLDNIK